MKPYKPQFMGFIAPFDDPAAMSDFLKNKYEAFSIIFDTVKSQADKIESISTVGDQEPGSTSLSVSLTTTGDTLDLIRQEMTNANIFGNIITVST